MLSVMTCPSLIHHTSVHPFPWREAKTWIMDYRHCCCLCWQLMCSCTFLFLMLHAVIWQISNIYFSSSCVQFAGYRLWQLGGTCAWWDHLISEAVFDEEWQENTITLFCVSINSTINRQDWCLLFTAKRFFHDAHFNSGCLFQIFFHTFGMWCVLFPFFQCRCRCASMCLSVRVLMSRTGSVFWNVNTLHSRLQIYCDICQLINKLENKCV